MKSLSESILNEGARGTNQGWIQVDVPPIGVIVAHVVSNEREGVKYEILSGETLDDLDIPSRTKKILDDGTGSVDDSDGQDWYIRIF